MSIAVIIPTKNEELNLPHALGSVAGWASEVFVVDSGSTDRTESLAKAAGVQFFFHPWEGYARQKNWAIEHLPIQSKWIFILDADETITPELSAELQLVSSTEGAADGYFVNRYFIFLGRRIRHCGYYPSWNLRFFRRGRARYEEREVHEHMVVNGSTGYLRHHMEHNDRRGLETYIAKHNHYSTLEARELHNAQSGQFNSRGLRPKLIGDPIARRRWIKDYVWPRLPFRWLARFIYMFVYRAGFLDGAIGFHFCVFMTAYEHQIHLKLLEASLNQHKST